MPDVFVRALAAPARSYAASALSLLCGLAACAPSEQPPRIRSIRSAFATPLAWVQREPITESTAVDGSFGHVMAASGDVLLIGGTQSAHVFVRQADGSWVKDTTLLSEADGYYVTAAAAFATELALGVTSTAWSGVLLYTGFPGSWSAPQPLQANDVPPTGFGQSLAMNQDLLVVGALGYGLPGAAYVFERRTSGFEQVQKLTIATDNAFGAPVAVSGSVIFVGSEDPGTNGGWGAVHSYEKPGSAWVASTVFSAPEEYGFGTAIAANGQRLAIATIFGTLYIYERTASGFAQPAVLEPPPETTRSGASEVAIGDSAVVVGLPLDVYESQNRAGHAYISFFGTGGWSAPTWLPYTGAGPDDKAGQAVAVVTDAAFVGAPDSRLSTTGGVVRTYGPCRVDAECASGSYCDAGGACRSWKDDGAACDARAGADCRQSDCGVCRSRQCVDGVCCGSPCDAPCEACAEPGSEGRCITVTAPRTGKSCSAAGSACGGFCNGVERGCVYPAVGEPCDTECGDGVETASQCDGQGACVANAPRSCGGYICRDGACVTQCARDDECVSGFLCAQGLCVPTQRPACSADGTASTSPEGTTQCAPYRCNDATGACPQACASTRDCAEKYLCDTERRACVLEAGMPEEGCACRLQRKTSSRTGWLLILGTLGLARRRGKWSAHRRHA